MNRVTKKKGMRSKYEAHGVEGFYKEFSDEYRNPHEREVRELIEDNRHLFDCENVLDLCCGNGEVTKALESKNVAGCDPFTCKNYRDQTKKPCLELSFDDIISEGLDKKFSTIICSFGFHLCEESKLHALIARLLESTDTIVMITPHKRPELEGVCNLKKIHEAHALTDKRKKIRLRIYR